jgi:hypothetical protein
MAPTVAEINSLLASDVFSADVIPKFEEFVTAQASDATAYHADATRRLIKLYQSYPASLQLEKVAQACLLAAFQYPNHTDFLALKYLMPTTVREQEPVTLIQASFELLESCQYAAFWESYKALQASTVIGSFLTADTIKRMQGSILQVLSLTYKEAPAAVVLRALQAASLTDVKALSHPCVEIISGDMVIFVSSPENTKRQREYQESLNFESISALMSKISQ